MTVAETMKPVHHWPQALGWTHFPASLAVRFQGTNLQLRHFLYCSNLETMFQLELLPGWRRVAQPACDFMWTWNKCCFIKALRFQSSLPSFPSPFLSLFSLPSPSLPPFLPPSLPSFFPDTVAQCSVPWLIQTSHLLFKAVWIKQCQGYNAGDIGTHNKSLIHILLFYIIQTHHFRD